MLRKMDLRRGLAIVSLMGLGVTGWGGNWPAWRGADGSGIAAEADFPIHWGPEKNIKWKVELDGIGSSTPVVWGDRIFITTQNGQAIPGKKQLKARGLPFDDKPFKLFVECRSRVDGELLWRREAEPTAVAEVNKNNNMAGPSCVTDGEYVWSYFGTGDLLCHDFEGNLIWELHPAKEIGSFNLLHGHGSSPVLYRDLIIVHFGHHPGRYLPDDPAFAGKPHAYYVMGLDKKTGEQVYLNTRPLEDDDVGRRNGFGTPIIVEASGRDELIFAAHNKVLAYDPGTGEELWSSSGPGPQVISSPAHSEGVIVAPTGLQAPTVAVRAGGNGDVSDTHLLWEEGRGRPRVGSPVIRNGRVYVANDHGIASCYDLWTGEIVWQERLDGTHYASPAIAGDYVFFQTLEGDGYVIRESEEFEIVSTNPLGERVQASYAFSDGEIFIRSTSHLFCIANGD